MLRATLLHGTRPLERGGAGADDGESRKGRRKELADWINTLARKQHKVAAPLLIVPSSSRGISVPYLVQYGPHADTSGHALHDVENETDRTRNARVPT